MALIKSQVLTQASGSVGGLTYSHGKGGMYMRSRAIPVNPQTARQLQIRDAMSMYSQMFLQVLTQAQRDAWDLYGANVLVANRLGDQIQLSGQNHYIRANVSRQAANIELSLNPVLASINDAPTTFDLPIFAAPSAFLVSSTTGILFDFDDTQAWVNDADNILLIYQGRPRSVSRRFFKGPYRLVGAVRGDATTPPTSPVTIATGADAFPVAAGQLEKYNFVLSVGNATDQPTGLSVRAYGEGIVS